MTSEAQRITQNADQSSKVHSFILENTKLTSPPLLPEVSLYLAHESLPIWKKMEDHLDELNVPPPFWAFAWPGGQALARYILDRPEEIANKRILDIGAGSGLTAIAAAKAGAASVLAVDIDAFALGAIFLNAQANQVLVKAKDKDFITEEFGNADIILVGDLFYERPLAEKVMAFLRKVAQDKVKILIGDPQRTYFPKNEFCCITQYDVPVSLDLEDSSLKKTAVWQWVS
ncbi:MAG: class I SAM-dependent methyltransferase [Hyphomicrobium sp.]